MLLAMSGSMCQLPSRAQGAGVSVVVLGVAEPPALPTLFALFPRATIPPSPLGREVGTVNGARATPRPFSITELKGVLGNIGSFVLLTKSAHYPKLPLLCLLSLETGYIFYLLFFDVKSV
jgi:hypothetical protein